LAAVLWFDGLTRNGQIPYLRSQPEDP